MKTVNLSDISFDEQEEHAVLGVLRSRWLSTGEVTQAFEREFAEYVGARHAIATTNGTAALHLAVAALGLGPDDEVLVPSLTFVATVNAIRYVGATPVFVDVTSLDDWCLSIDSLRARLTPRSRAILPMHYAGYPCDMDAIASLASQHGLRVIEDAAHSPGSWLGEKHLGTFGEAGCFSFFANKNLATGEGGMVVADDDELAQRIRHLRSHGMTTMSWERDRGHAFQYDVVALGYNYRFDELRAALGRVQLRKLDDGNAARACIHSAYVERLKAVDKIRMPFLDRVGRFSRHLFPILLDPSIDRVSLMKRLRARGVQSSIHYPPAHQFSIHRDLAAGSLPITESVGQRVLTLPLHPRLTIDDVDYVVDALIQSL